MYPGYNFCLSVIAFKVFFIDFNSFGKMFQIIVSDRLFAGFEFSEAEIR